MHGIDSTMRNAFAHSNQNQTNSNLNKKDAMVAYYRNIYFRLHEQSQRDYILSSHCH